MNAILKSKQEAAASRLDAAVLPEAAGWSKAAREDALARVRRWVCRRGATNTGSIPALTR
jgi:hypothetical protein